MNYIILDTETCPIDRDLDKVTPDNMLYYDLGWVVCNEMGRVLETQSFVNSDIFQKEKDLMKSAYYAEKIPKYLENIAKGERIVANAYEIRKALVETMARYNTTKVFAFNVRFDYGTLNNTQRYLTNSKYRYFFPKGTEIYDILKMARQVVATDENYKEFCRNNGYVTKNNRVQVKAETVYKFITDNNDFNESHTGLEDSIIEKEILFYCLNRMFLDEGKLW